MEKHYEYTTDEGLEVAYSVWEDSGDRLQPPSVDIEIKKIIYEGVDVYDLLDDIAHDYIYKLREDLRYG